MLTADEQAQANADRRFAGVAGPLWRVQLGGWPCITVPGESRDHAIGRYCEVMGITASQHPPAAELIEDYPHELPTGLRELEGDGEPS